MSGKISYFVLVGIEMGKGGVIFYNFFSLRIGDEVNSNRDSLFGD